MRKIGLAIAAITAVALCVMLGISYFSGYKVVNGIIVSELLLAVSERKHINYCKLLKKATKNDSTSIRAFTLLEYGDGTSYDHGRVIVDLIDIIGEDNFLQSLATINDEEKCRVDSYLSVGLEYYGKNPRPGGKKLEEAFPKIYNFINYRETVPETHDTLPVITYDTLADKRDGKTYKTVIMPDGKRWMAENLNYKTDSSWCYDNADSNCVKYGRLYTWNTAMKVCPAGYHLPSNEEWDSLGRAVGGVQRNSFWLGAGTVLKAKSGWDDYIKNGSDDYEITAFIRTSDSTFQSVDYGFWWTATERNNDSVYVRYASFINNDAVGMGYYNTSNGYSVRCVADAQ